MNTLVPTNGNGHKPAAALEAVESTAVGVPAYHPSLRDWVYLSVVEEILAKDGRVSDQAIANLLPKRAVKDPATGEVVGRPLTSQAVWKMRHRPGFEDWIGAQFRAQTDRDWPHVLRRALILARRGSIDHMDFLAKIRGEFATPSAVPLSVQTALIIEVRHPGAERAADGSRIPAEPLRIIEG